MNWSPHITVASVLERNSEFLLVEENVDGQLVLNQPAGHWENGESLIEATVRETLEETAWHYQPTHITGIYQWTHPVSSETYLRFCFTGTLLERDHGRQLDKGIERAVWLTHDQMQLRSQDHRSPLVLKCVNDYLSGKRFELSMFQFG
jgi:NADH pyrophosphatase NudC (nudix superfamily)